jgi:hypothetical protein
MKAVSKGVDEKSILAAAEILRVLRNRLEEF